MSYNERKQRGNEFENEVAKYLERSGYTVTRCGVEETHNAEFVRLVANTSTPLAKFVRNQPDGYCINNHGIIAAWDAKVGLNISRDAWEAYQHVALIGPVNVFFKTPTSVWHGKVANIDLAHGDETTAGFGASAYPRDRDGWICPRMSARGYHGGSGSPYKQVRAASLDPVTDWDNAK